MMEAQVNSKKLLKLLTLTTIANNNCYFNLFLKSGVLTIVPLKLKIAVASQMLCFVYHKLRKDTVSINDKAPRQLRNDGI